MIDIEAIKAREQAATPGKWEYDYNNCVSMYDEKGIHELDICECEDICTENAEANGEFIARAREDIPALLAELATVTAQRDKAVEDMKLIADAIREERCDETCCFACKYNADFSVTDSGSFANECPGFDRDDCFKWRGERSGE